MTKRGADRDDDDEAEADAQGFEASPEKLASRTFVKVKRKEAGEDAKTAAPEPINAFAALIDPTNWECSQCAVSNKKDLLKCAACEEPRPGTPAAVAAATTASTPVNGFAALIDPTTWECQSCEVRNKKDVTKCAACEEPRAGTAEAKGSANPGFNFGSTVSFGTTESTAIPSFSFGTTTSSWSFGTAPFTFGAATSSFTFGSNTTGPMSFGDVSGGTFASESPTVFETTGQLPPATDQTREEFKGKSAEPSGTEKDATIFKVPAIAYVLTKVEGGKAEDGTEEKATTKFVESGEGDLKINTVEKDGTTIARAIMRTEKTQRLVLNAPLFSGMTLQQQGEKYVKFASNDLEGKTAVYLLKLKNKTESSQVKEHMEQAIAATLRK